MTVIRPNSISGVTSITALANEINVFRHNGVLAGLQLNGVNHHTSAGVSTFHTLNVLGNLDVAGVLTYQDVTNVDSLGIGTFRTGINVSGGQLDVGSNIKLGNAGVITATSFSGDGSNLTGIVSDKIFEGNTEVETVDTGSDGHIKFTTEGTERARIDSNGILKLGTSLSANHVSNVPTDVKFFLNSGRGNYGGLSSNAIIFDNQTAAVDAGGTLTLAGFTGSQAIAKAAIRGGNEGSSSTQNGYFTVYTRPTSGNLTERLRITSDGNIGAGGITSPLWTSGGGIHLNDNYGIGFGNGGSGRPDFQLMVTDGSKLEFRCGFGADTADIVMDTSGRLLIGTTSQTISSSELFEVKSSASGFSHFRNNSSSYAPIYIDNEATNNGSTLVPLITITDGGGNRAGFLMNNTSVFDMTGQGAVTFSTGGTVGNATERLRVEHNNNVGKVTVQGEASGGTTYGLEIIGNQQTNAVAGCDAGARIIAPVARRMYFELRANDDTDHIAWLGNPDYNTGVADTILMELHPKGYLQKPLQPGFFQRIMDGSTFNNNGVLTGGTNQFNTGNHYNTSTGIFTAPIAGRYAVGCGVLVQINSGRLEGNIKLNNSTRIATFNGTGTTYDGPNVHFIINLSANDNLRIVRQMGTAYPYSHDNFYFYAYLVG